MTDKEREALDRYCERSPIVNPPFHWWRDGGIPDKYYAYWNKNTMVCDKTYFPIEWIRTDTETDLVNKLSDPIKVSTPKCVQTQTWIGCVFEPFVYGNQTNGWLKHWLIKENTNGGRK